jgi:hypothetical protein
MFSYMGFMNLFLIYGVGLAVLWLVIYSAVRAALSSHRKALARERSAGPQGFAGPQ